EREAFDRLGQMTRRAEKEGLRLLHENEHRIYGDTPFRIVKLFRAVASPAFRAVYDAANYVFCGSDPLVGWQVSQAVTAHFHAKAWKSGEQHGRLMGEGHGRWPEVFADAVKLGYSGFATLEPHLLGGGPTGGVTGPDLFPKAAAALRELLKTAGAKVA